MRLLISHFHNEEYLLPWWVRHHVGLFDHAVLINHRSTDRSCEIIRALAPHWEIVETTSRHFDARLCDEEVMYHERRYEADLKLVLNTTEFLVCEDILELERLLGRRSQTQAILSGALMVDLEPERIPDPEKSLPAQKNHGVWETELWYGYLPRRLVFVQTITRSRIVHCSPHGAYDVGRHRSHLPRSIKVDRSVAAIWWYGFSPFNPEVLKRKMQIAGQISAEDRRKGHGFQHLSTRPQIQQQYEYFRKRSGRLRLVPITPWERGVAAVRAFATAARIPYTYKRIARKILR